jgi:hypothetical protein
MINDILEALIDKSATRGGNPIVVLRVNDVRTAIEMAYMAGLRQRSCGLCGKPGHNRRSCKERRP